MQIVDIKTFPTWVGSRNQLVVKVETDAGSGRLGRGGRFRARAGGGGRDQTLPRVPAGQGPDARGALWQEMYRSQYFEGGRVLTGAISAIDIALYDIAGKALGVPVYQLLGGKHRDFIPCFATTAAPMGPRLLEDAQLLIERGWSVIRTTPGHPDRQGDETLFEPRESIGVTAEWLTRLRESVGPAALGIDYHHRLSVPEAASFCQRMPRGTLDFLEEPIRAESPEAYAALRSMTDVPFAIGEEFASKWAFLPFIEQGLTNFIRVDVCNVGGLTEAMKVAGWAEAHYLDLMPHNPLGPICTAATIHLAAAVPNFAWLEVRTSPTEQLGFDNSELFPSSRASRATAFPCPRRPGLGVEFDETKAAQQEFRFWEAPHLHRRDGSYTNW